MKKERQKKEECGAPYRPWLYRQVDRVKGTLFFFSFVLHFFEMLLKRSPIEWFGNSSELYGV